MPIEWKLVGLYTDLSRWLQTAQDWNSGSQRSAVIFHSCKYLRPGRRHRRHIFDSRRSDCRRNESQKRRVAVAGYDSIGSKWRIRDECKSIQNLTTVTNCLHSRSITFLQSFAALRGGFTILNQRWILSAAHIYDGLTTRSLKLLLYIVGGFSRLCIFRNPSSHFA